MADFKKIKINNTTYNVKDEGAGRSLSVSGQDLSLKDSANNVLSTVTLPGGGGGVADIPKLALPKDASLKYVYNATTKQLLWKYGQATKQITLSYDIELYFGNKVRNDGNFEIIPYRSNGVKKWTYTDANDTHMLGGGFKMGINNASTPKAHLDYNARVDFGEKYMYLVSGSTYRLQQNAQDIRNIIATGVNANYTPISKSNIRTLNHCVVIYDNEVIDTEYNNADFYIRITCDSGTLKIRSDIDDNNIMFDINEPVNDYFATSPRIGSKYTYTNATTDEFNNQAYLLDDHLTSITGNNVLMNLSYFENL